jgi:hypothetical protein
VRQVVIRPAQSTCLSRGPRASALPEAGAAGVDRHVVQWSQQVHSGTPILFRFLVKLPSVEPTGRWRERRWTQRGRRVGRPDRVPRRSRCRNDVLPREGRPVAFRRCGVNGGEHPDKLRSSIAALIDSQHRLRQLHPAAVRLALRKLPIRPHQNDAAYLTGTESPSRGVPFLAM